MMTIRWETKNFKLTQNSTPNGRNFSSLNFEIISLRRMATTKIEPISTEPCVYILVNKHTQS